MTICRTKNCVFFKDNSGKSGLAKYFTSASNLTLKLILIIAIFFKFCKIQQIENKKTWARYPFTFYSPESYGKIIIPHITLTVTLVRDGDITLTPLLPVAPRG